MHHLSRLKPTAGVRCASGLMLRLPQTDNAVMRSLEKLYAAWERPFACVSPLVGGSGQKWPDKSTSRGRAFHRQTMHSDLYPRTEIQQPDLSAIQEGAERQNA